MTLRNRLRVIERLTAAAVRREDRDAKMLAELDRERAEFLKHVPPDLRPAAA